MNLFYQNRDAAGGLGAHDEDLGDVGSLGGAADEGAVAVIVEGNPLVGFVHIAHYGVPRKQYDKMLAYKTDCLFLHRLGDPDAAVLGDADRAGDNSYDFAFGMNWSGVISDARVNKYKIK